MTKAQIKAKYGHMIADWYEPSGEDFKYDIFLRLPYAWDFWNRDAECQQIEHFDTLKQVESALRNVKVATVEKNCCKCKFFDNGQCIA